MKVLDVSWEECREIALKWDLKPGTRVYGVPRGGAVAMLLHPNIIPVASPEEADVIVDDLIDSGATRDRFAHYGKPFLTLFDKQKDSGFGWINFPWEAKDEGIEDNVRRILQRYDNPAREGLIDTPKRYAKFFDEFFAVPEVKFTTFKNEGIDEMIVQRDIFFHSFCEHHIAPFFGTAVVAYIPGDKIVGLSKLARTVDYYAHRFQNQERITQQIAERLVAELNPRGVAVMLTARHTCMELRGVRKNNAFTTTSMLTGIFKDDIRARSEFLALSK